MNYLICVLAIWVVEFDDWCGWYDFPGTAWNIMEEDIQLYDGLEYDVDE